jgi:hypothetical protein
MHSERLRQECARVFVHGNSGRTNAFGSLSHRGLGRRDSSQLPTPSQLTQKTGGYTLQK